MATANRPAPKSRGGVSSRASSKKEKRPPQDCPDFTREEVKNLEPLRTRCRDLLGSDTVSGTDMMHAKSLTYLPIWPGEDSETYKIRSTLTELYGGYERCVVASRGLVFAKPPELSKDADPQIVEMWDNVDGMKTPARVFLKDSFTDGFDGIAGIRTDFPKIEPGVRLDIDEFRRRKLRPRWIRITADQIVNWKVATIENEPTFTMMVLREEVEENSGEFGLECVEQYRAYHLALVAIEGSEQLRRQITYKIWRKRVVNDVVEWYIHDDGEIRGPTHIPIDLGYFAPSPDPVVAKPPLASLADLNLGHYRVSADRRWLMSIVHAPTLAIEKYSKPKNPDGTEAPESPITLGPSAVLKLSGEATAKWLQADPNGLDSSKQEKDDLVAQMAAMSIAFMAQERRAQETATAHRINALATNASLAIMATGLEDMANAALVTSCEYLGIATPPKVKINTEYDEDVLDAPTILALNQLEKDANLTKGTLLLILQRSKVIPIDVDLVKEEREALAEAAARQMIAEDIASGGDPLTPPVSKRGRKKKLAAKSGETDVIAA
jgi:hypothetical protein